MRIRTLLAALVLASAAAPPAGAALAATPAAKTATTAFRSLGLPAIDPGGYSQTIRYREQTLLLDRSSAAFVGGGAETVLSLGEGLILDPSTPQPGRVEAPLVFIGYGVHLPQAGHDDFAALDLRGKIAVYIDAAPASLTAEQAASARLLVWSAVERTGAVGVVAIPASETAWAERRAAIGVVGRYPADARLQDLRGARLDAALAPAEAQGLFAASGVAFDQLLASALAGRPLPAFELGRSLRINVAMRLRQGVSEGVAAMLQGSDPYLARNYVVVSAPEAEAQALLALAAAAAAAPNRARRTLIFALLPDAPGHAAGARALAERLGVSRDVLVAAIHLQRQGPAVLALSGGADSSLGETARATAQALGMTLAAAGEVGAASGFARAGAPALTLYAAPGAQAFVLALAKRIADRDTRPSWRSGSPFAPPAPSAQETLTTPLEMPVGKRPQRLLPTYG